MDSKLQQAINATRAGYNDAAQILLTDALQENPQETDAWFLLAHLVESTERQARYLEYTLFLDPEYLLARQHLERLRNPEVPPPVIKEYSNHGSTSPHTTPPPTVDSKFSPIPPARTNPVLSISSKPETSSTTGPSGNQQTVAEKNSSRVDADWQKTAGPPQRASRLAAATPVQQQAAPNTAVVTETVAENNKKEPVNKWLLAILIILIVIAAFVISYLAVTIFIQ